ncbi:MAG: UPF0182 family protein [Clostridia bacterium]|nr:UPF0182 family protein [Clostridia bacterium]
MKNNKKRVILVILFLTIFAIYLAITLRGEYLQTLQIGEEYISVFEQNVKYKIGIALVNFLILYISTYITNRFIKRGLKKFFDEDKKQMPKLPNKSISLIFGVIVSIITSKLITEKAMLALNTAWFGVNDPIFNLDIGYYMFQKPLIESMLLYFIVLMAIYSVYVALYYIITFNVYFDKGIDATTLKKNTFIKHIITNIVLIIIAISLITIINVQDIVFGEFLNLPNNIKLNGAGLVDTTIRTWGYRIFAAIILICSVIAIHNFKKEKFKKVMIALCGIPVYLVLLFIVMLGFDLIYVNNNELDKEKKYIEYNISYTKNAYDINIDEIQIQNSGTIKAEDISDNQEVINNINLVNNDIVLETLSEYQTNSGYYSYKTTKPGLYEIEDKEQLVNISPREIVSNDTRTYNNKTFEYTHGYGTIITSATKVDENGNLEYIQSEFSNEDNKIEIKEPRIYFGLETNDPIITNAKNKQEFDYPLTSTTSSTNAYNGEAGLKLNFIDRLILGIKQGNLGIAFSGNITKDSKIITTRNIIQRAKTIMPYLKYDKEPYMVITDEGKLMWVLDAYTTSNNYPYSQETIIEYEGIKEKINYIRNSVKILIDPYNGTTTFYIVDKTDPIVTAYKNIYPELFKSAEEMPNDVAKHIVYSKYLYDIQAKMLEKYHNVQAEVLYRQDDIWDRAKENTTRTTSSSTGTYIDSYYTQVKTVDNNSSVLGLVVPYTIAEKQNIISYLVGTYDEQNNKKLTLYKFKTENAILGTTQLDTLVEQDETISKELNALNITGTRIEKNIIVVPINNTLLYVEPIYQVMLNDETQVPLLKKVVVASGNKVAIGNDIKEAIANLLSQEAIDIEIVSENKDELIEQIINANKNLEQSNVSNNWEMIGKDMAKLQELIEELEKIVEQENLEEQEELETDQNVEERNTI